jgi:hypothetical protein
MAAAVMEFNTTEVEGLFRNAVAFFYDTDFRLLSRKSISKFSKAQQTWTKFRNSNAMASCHGNLT